MTRGREENREYMRRYRAGLKDATVTELRPSSTAAVDAVREEIASLDAAAKRPSEVAVAMAMARILDDPGSIPQQASAANRLMAAMDSLRRESGARGRSKLSFLQEKHVAREDRAKNLDSSGAGSDT